MKTVFIIGDSISLHYHQYIKKLLENKAQYYRKGSIGEIEEALHDPNNPFGANGGDSNLVVEYMEELKCKNKKFDILLINCGLHDIRVDRRNNKIQLDENQYRENLNKIIEISKDLSNKLIWISTTPVNDEIHNSRNDGYLRYNKDVQKYNELAQNVMKTNNIKIIDLYEFTKKLENEDMYRDHVHYKEEIYEKQAQFIYDNIKELL